MIYVDALQAVPTEKRKSGWRWPLGAHLFSDCDLVELHNFARRLGLRREWFQHRPGRLPHYDVTDRKRALAISLGAEPCGRHQVLEARDFFRQEETHASRS